MKHVTLLTAIGLAAISSAQVNYLEPPTNVSFRLGYVYPVDATMRDIAASYIGVGADFVTDIRLLQDATTMLSIDWMGKSGSGAKGNAFPILLNQRFYLDGKDPEHRDYFQIGAGVAIVDLTSTKTVLAGRVGVGRELGDALFGEINFFYSDGANGARATALGFYLGYKF
ncbi:MAG: hypothetical protein JNM28_09840 [Armatimonadetes bacterium]|nr:hypothetical protein [Armatimonadota bacterium]MBS1710637.1 hypothetical protein [Armatimonadota bacterium]MBX3108308.1 hypothetical protein [Fimbriimonadaceae bacterium]